MAIIGNALLAQTDGSAVGGIVTLLLMAAMGLTVAVGMWKAFAKAGEPGWAIFIPVYNAVVFLKIAGKPVWWLLLMLIPVVNFIVAIVASIDFAKAFGKGTGFGLGVACLSFVFLPILGFGDARYKPVAA